MGKKVNKAAGVEKSFVGGKNNFNLGDLRSKFDGLKDVAKKLPEGAQKTTFMTKIEEIYLSTATWIQGITGGANQPV